FHAARGANRRYLLEDHTISYAPSATVLLICGQREARRTPAEGALLCGWEGSGDDRLRFVQQELRDLPPLLGAEPIHGALRLAVIRPGLQRARLFHLACHGESPTDAHPRFARLRLGGDILYAYDLHALRRRADVLTLSACNTGQHGDGLQGLVSAGLVA